MVFMLISFFLRWVTNLSLSASLLSHCAIYMPQPLRLQIYGNLQFTLPSFIFTITSKTYTLFTPNALIFISFFYIFHKTNVCHQIILSAFSTLFTKLIIINYSHYVQVNLFQKKCFFFF